SIATPLRSTRCPYTTLFRSSPVMGREAKFFCWLAGESAATFTLERSRVSEGRGSVVVMGFLLVRGSGRCSGVGCGEVERHEAGRSEEHTSELQSRENLVCRL